MRLNRYSFCFIALCALACVFSGCQKGSPGSRAGLVKASGTVTYNGEKIVDAIIEMRPVDETITNAFAAGRTDEQGVFTMTTDRPNDGALPGKYRVVVKKEVEMVGDMTRDEYIKQEEAKGNKDVTFDKDKLTLVNALPAKYADPLNSPLEIEIPAGGNKNIELVLED